MGEDDVARVLVHLLRVVHGEPREVEAHQLAVHLGVPVAGVGVVLLRARRGRVREGERDEETPVRRVDGQVVRRLVPRRVHIDGDVDDAIAVAIEHSDRVRAVVGHVRGARAVDPDVRARCRRRARRALPPAPARDRAHNAESRYNVSVRVLEAAAAFALTLGLLYTTPEDALANGRFPKAQTIVLPAGGDGSTIYLRTTFGVLVSHDANGPAPRGTGSASRRSASPARGTRPSRPRAIAACGSRSRTARTRPWTAARSTTSPGSRGARRRSRGRWRAATASSR